MAPEADTLYPFPLQEGLGFWPCRHGRPGADQASGGRELRSAHRRPRLVGPAPPGRCWGVDGLPPL